MFTIHIGDRVQARKWAGGDVVVSEFTATAIDGTTMAGSPLGPLDSVDGWEFELLSRGNPGLPTVLSDLAVWLMENPSEPCRVVGPIEGVWQTARGVQVDPASVLDWMPWADYTPPAPDEPPTENPEN